ncbi:11826_t:CDS:1 [Diversispora eburnea]|uniref:11826_t:CDS:1 n=1 Tax=Diversispora eburnea TaxID=1213867 RepID=A0A9N8W020_9GLOM|nr:11826_t:CDS:1 [Diversispora eburnea]
METKEEAKVNTTSESEPEIILKAAAFLKEGTEQRVTFDSVSRVKQQVNSEIKILQNLGNKEETFNLKTKYYKIFKELTEGELRWITEIETMKVYTKGTDTNGSYHTENGKT